MADIKHKLVIKSAPEVVFNAVTTQDGLEGWWAKETIAKPEVGFVNQFTFGSSKSEMEITNLEPLKMVEWKVLISTEEWLNTHISFDLEEKEGRTILRFTHSGWKAETDFYAACNYDWARFMTSLKSFCETGSGMPS